MQIIFLDNSELTDSPITGERAFELAEPTSERGHD